MKLIFSPSLDGLVSTLYLNEFDLSFGYVTIVNTEADKIDKDTDEVITYRINIIYRNGDVLRINNVEGEYLDDVLKTIITAVESSDMITADDYAPVQAVFANTVKYLEFISYDCITANTEQKRELTIA